MSDQEIKDLFNLSIEEIGQKFIQEQIRSLRDGNEAQQALTYQSLYSVGVILAGKAPDLSEFDPIETSYKEVHALVLDHSNEVSSAVADMMKNPDKETKILGIEAMIAIYEGRKSIHIDTPEPDTL